MDDEKSIGDEIKIGFLVKIYIVFTLIIIVIIIEPEFLHLKINVLNCALVMIYEIAVNLHIFKSWSTV